MLSVGKEAIGKRWVTVDKGLRLFPEPFFVIATQKPSNEEGMFPLWSFQLYLFLLRVELCHPDSIAERILMEGHERWVLLAMSETQSNCGNCANRRHAGKR